MGWPKLNVFADYYYEDVMNLSQSAIARLQWGPLKKHERNSVMTIIHIGQVVFYTYATILWKYLRIEINFYSWNATFFIWGRHNLYMFHMRWWLTQSICAALECVISKSLQLNQVRRHQNMPSKCTLLFVIVLASVGTCISWIWLTLRCWGNSSIPEGRFSKWF